MCIHSPTAMRWKPDSYELGRPFPPEQVTALFEPLRHSKGPLNVLEAGCGAGRVLIPLAQSFPAWKFTGIDSSGGSLEVCRRRCSDLNVPNLVLHEAALESSLPRGPFDLIIHSSVLHVIPEWRKAMGELCLRLGENGLFCLIGEYGDIYAEVLGRPTREGIDLSLTRFWSRYRELRREFGAPDPERSQIGCRWDLDNSDLAAWLERSGYREVLGQKVQWNMPYSRDTLLRIVEERSYSSMFTVPADTYGRIVQRLRHVLPALGIADSVSSRHEALARFYRKGNSVLDVPFSDTAA